MFFLPCKDYSIHPGLFQKSFRLFYQMIFLFNRLGTHYQKGVKNVFLIKY